MSNKRLWAVYNHGLGEWATKELFGDYEDAVTYAEQYNDNLVIAIRIGTVGRAFPLKKDKEIQDG